MVGDDDQTIYQFRGSESENILQFHKRYKGIKEITLDDNFRCSPAIVQLANEIVRKNKNRLNKTVCSKSCEVYEPGDIAIAELDTPAEEAQFIAERIKELTKAGYKYSDIAVLCRKKRTVPDITKALVKAEVPHIVEGINELFRTREIIAVCECFYYLQKKFPSMRQDNYRNEQFQSKWKNIHKDITAEKVRQVLTYLDSIKIDGLEKGNDLVLQDIFFNIVQQLDFFEDSLNPEKLREVIMYNFGMFSKVINDFETVYYTELPAEKLRLFCQFIESTARDKYEVGITAKSYVQPDAVRVMTVHGAKGLEFPVVFIPNLNDKSFPSINFGEEHIWNVIVPKKAIENQKRFDGCQEDERKMFYVAITRAKKILFLSRSKTVFSSQWGKHYPVPASPFFKEVQRSSVVRPYAAWIGYDCRNIISGASNPPPIVLNFMFLQRYFECPYLFKLAFIYGFHQPLIEAYGYGKSLRDIAIKIHTRKSDELMVDLHGTVGSALNRHFNIPYAVGESKQRQTTKAAQLLNDCFVKMKAEQANIKYVEHYIEIDMGSNIIATGKTAIANANGQQVIYDLVASSIHSAEQIKTEQLQIRAFGLAQANERTPDYVEVFNLDSMKAERTPITPQLLNDTQATIDQVSQDMRANIFRKKKVDGCKDCFLKNLCQKQGDAK